MRYQGKIVEWNDTKGYGFVLPNAGGRKIFFHASEFPGTRGAAKPTVAQLVTFEIGLDHERRSCAVNVVPVASVAARMRARERAENRDARATGSNISVLLALIWTASVVAYAMLTKLAWFGVAIWFALNLITMVVYASDKSAAEHGHWRTRESTLHLLALLGGWPAAAFAQRKFRHKSSKTEFRFVFWCTVIANVGLAMWLARIDFFPMLLPRS